MPQVRPFQRLPWAVRLAALAAALLISLHVLKIYSFGSILGEKVGSLLNGGDPPATAQRTPQGTSQGTPSTTGVVFVGIVGAKKPGPNQ